MDLSLVIPVWNDLPGLDRLLRQVAAFDLFCEVIIVDDASDKRPGPETVPEARALADRITWLRSDGQRGAGHARNMALEHIRGSHVIFFDSDDLFTNAFPRIVARAAAETEPFDFLIFRHDDSRILATGRQGAFPNEEKLWQGVGATDRPTALDLKQAAELCRLSAYPWNKIYRTGFLRDNHICCTEIMVHNDVELHWSGFVAARRILACTLSGAIHFVDDDGRRLTNRRSADRLEVFRAFEHVMHRISGAPSQTSLTFLQPFSRFSCNLIHWVRDNIEESLHPELRMRAQQHFLASLDRRLMTLIAYADPALADKINRLIQQGELP